ncbi:unnamed protein product [Ceutorhynchus assimilis]|uniref:Zinc finger PHD-type domain-containing protein n=1 Tax=Ceutorhynchus assimilis TaxID=467358 RepID=A0A9N9MAT4_9CUCU|nr:unnamed protein product [Ceutorhynchus assimilis]
MEKVPEQPDQSIVGSGSDKLVQEPSSTQHFPALSGISPIALSSAIERIARPQSAGTQSAGTQSARPQIARQSRTRTIARPIRRYHMSRRRPHRSIVRDTSPIAGPSGIQRSTEESEIEPVIQLPPKPKSVIDMMELLALKPAKKVDSGIHTDRAIIKKRLLKGKMIISSNINHIWCPSCSEIDNDSTWIQCDTCTRWWHQDCTQYPGSGEFLCEICRF